MQPLTPASPDVANGHVDPWVMVSWEPGMEDMHQLMFDMANMRDNMCVLSDGQKKRDGCLTGHEDEDE